MTLFPYTTLFRSLATLLLSSKSYFGWSISSNTLKAVIYSIQSSKKFKLFKCMDYKFELNDQLRILTVSNNASSLVISFQAYAFRNQNILEPMFVYHNICKKIEGESQIEGERRAIFSFLSISVVWRKGRK